jgi:hypothetical protein
MNVYIFMSIGKKIPRERLRDATWPAITVASPHFTLDDLSVVAISQ